MKKISTSGKLLLLCFLLSCSGRNDGNINITVSDSEDIYKLTAEFDERKNRALEKCMNDHLGNNSNFSFINSRIDGDITLDDHTTFYIKKKSGYLKIVFDKDKNSKASYNEVKAFSEELKQALKD